jgi:hypothetical protein
MVWVQYIIHYSLHFIAPMGIAYTINKGRWKRIYLIFVSTMLIDLDHLLVTPIFEAKRCSIGFHPLHSCIAVGVYCVLLVFSKTRIFGIGFLFHILTDLIDCMINSLLIQKY